MSRFNLLSCKRRFLPVSLLLLLGAVSVPSVAPAAVGRPHWGIIAMPAPTYFKPGDEGDYVEVVAVNDGSAAMDGTTFSVTDSLPHGIVGTASFGDAGVTGHNTFGQAGISCPSVDRCESAARVEPGEIVKIKFMVSLEPEAVGGGSVTISGGGAEAVTVPTAVTISSAPVPFGVAVRSDLVTEGAGGPLAGSHPLAFTTMLAFNVAYVRNFEKCRIIFSSAFGCPELNADAKDLEVTVPPGLVGNATAAPRCPQAMFQEEGIATCPSDTQVGVLQLGFYGKQTDQFAAVYNIEPPPGQPAELGFTVGGAFHIPMFFNVRTGGDYALQAHLSGITGADPVHYATLSIWGVPAAASHDTEREGRETLPGGCPALTGCVSHAEEKPFLTLPTNCSGSEMTVSVAGDSWQEPGTLGSLPVLAEAKLAPVTGCDALAFGPSISVAPDTLLAGVPAGYDVKVHVPQSEDPNGRATPDVRDVQLTLPQGTVISPSSANGLAACTEAQFGLHARTAGHCPSQANIGRVEIATPLLDAPLRGNVFLGAPECRPCTPADAGAGKMVPLLIEAKGSGVVIKLAGHTRIDQATGQLTTVFTENPQLPFSDLEVTLKGGDGAPLVNPTSCGAAVAVAKLTPWSSMTAIEATAPPIPISGCSSPGFSPSLHAGAATARAGAFSAFSLTLSRPEGQQTLRSVTVDTPPGLLGMLSKVSLCSEGQANTGACPAASAIGEASTTVGPGAQPLTIVGGKVFLTGPYEGKPFGLSIVMPTEAGPFQLAGNTGGPTEVVRASIAVDPHTAALTVASDVLPSRLEGVPLDIRSVNVDINKVGFMFNPTDCDAMSIGGTATSTSGTVSSISFPFQAADCAALAFSPKFAVSTRAKTSKAGGASLHVKVTAAVGQANIHAVKVDLPIQLPSRNSTLQKACPAAIFQANPASCPTASVVGAGKAVTPVLANPLTGPAYLVSHGGAALPDLEIVLQGQGITLILDGTTHIKKGITSSTFKSTPDAPVSTFNLNLPAGPHSVLAANLPASARRSMCGQRLRMPTMITAQNGAVIKQTTAITVTGCPKAKAKKSRRKPPRSA